MDKKEKIIKGFECCAQELNCSNCPYNETAGSLCHKTLFNDFKDYFLNPDTAVHSDLLPCIAYAMPDLRPCIVKGEKVYFHQWANWQDADNLLYPVAIVEKEDGRCSCVDITDIKFTDRNVKND